MRLRLLAQLNNPEFQKKRLAGLIKRPTKPELRLKQIIEENNLPFRYVGNGGFLIGRANPDFVSTDDSKRIIEVFGDYWHTLETLSPISTETGRVRIFSEFGYKTLILWESKLKMMSDVEVAVSIKNWMYPMEVIAKSG